MTEHQQQFLLSSTRAFMDIKRFNKAVFKKLTKSRSIVQQLRSLHIFIQKNVKAKNEDVKDNSFIIPISYELRWTKVGRPLVRIDKLRDLPESKVKSLQHTEIWHKFMNDYKTVLLSFDRHTAMFLSNEDEQYYMLIIIYARVDTIIAKHGKITDDGYVMIKNAPLDEVIKDVINKKNETLLNLILKAQSLVMAYYCGDITMKQLLQCRVVNTKDGKRGRELEIDYKPTFRAVTQGVNTHYRSQHYRVLRDERFKRHQDGSFKIVRVRGSIVHRDNQLKVARK